MKRLTKKQIKEINNSVDWEQGIYIQPMGVPNEIKTHVIYLTWKKEGEEGGTCWGDKPEYFKRNPPEFKVLDAVLRVLSPNITYLQYKEVECLIQENSEEQPGYYGNWTDHGVKYIILDKLYELLEKFENEIQQD